MRRTPLRLTSSIKGQFFRRKETTVLTWKGWVILVLLVCLALGVFLKNLRTFLTQNSPCRPDILAVDQFLPDYALAEAVEEFRRGGYRLLVATGTPLPVGSYLLEFDTCAHLSAETLRRMGMEERWLREVPAKSVQSGRTVASARAVRDWLARSGTSCRSINLVSLGAHARRTRYLYDKVFAGEVCVGIIAVRDRDYDPDRWWAYSTGFRSVTEEAIAYAFWRIRMLLPRGSLEER